MTICYFRDQNMRLCLLQMPVVLQIAFFKIFKYTGAFFIKLCIILPDLGVLKITLPKTSLDLWWCAITLTYLKRQGMHKNWSALKLKIVKLHQNLKLYCNLKMQVKEIHAFYVWIMLYRMYIFCLIYVTLIFFFFFLFFFFCLFH